MPSPAGLMKPPFASARKDFCGFEESGVREGDSVKRSVEGVSPEIEKPAKHGKVRRQIVVLPNIGLQDRRMIWHSVENSGRRQAVTLQLPINGIWLAHYRPHFEV